MKLCKAVVLVLIVWGWVAPSCAMGAAREVPLDNRAKCVAGGYYYYDEECAVGGKLYQSYGEVDSSYEFATFSIGGYDRFTCYLGGRDGRGFEGTLIVEVDGEELCRQRVSVGAQAKAVDIALTGHKALTLRSMDGTGSFLEPKLIKGTTPAKPGFKCPTCGQEFGSKGVLDMHIEQKHGAVPPPPPVAPFSLDPSGLDTLAKSLWDQCQAKPKLKEKVENGNVAVATFRSIGGLPGQTPAGVAADLYTAMIKSGFTLVERGQLDKVLGELKIHDTALVDPATAKKIGKLAGCDLMLLGEITDSDALIIINARLMETETGKSVCAERVQLRKIFSRS